MKKNSRKTFIVGDVHGCFEEFLALLKKIDYDPESHRLILIGDIINRGPFSLEMLKWVRERGIEMVRGNHEQAFLNGINKDIQLNPIFRKLQKDMKGNLEKWVHWLSGLPFYIEEKNFLVVHGGLVPGERPKYSDPHLLMNIRTWDGVGKDIKNELNPAWYSFYKGKKLVIYGHWANQGLNIRKNTIGLDTGCVYGHKLSGLLLPDRKVFQVSSIKNYYLSHL